MDDDALHELTAAYALDALEPVEALAYERHLAHCERCQAELAALSAAAGALAFGVDPAEPPAALRERILSEARAERSNVVPLQAYGFYRRHYARVLAVAASTSAVTSARLASSLPRDHGAFGQDRSDQWIDIRRIARERRRQANTI